VAFLYLVASLASDVDHRLDRATPTAQPKRSNLQRVNSSPRGASDHGSPSLCGRGPAEHTEGISHVPEGGTGERSPKQADSPLL
jgi:hypothetical protein